jgi:hypothetical protein
VHDVVPSVKTSASTHAARRHALDGKTPQSTCGVMFSMTTRALSSRASLITRERFSERQEAVSGASGVQDVSGVSAVNGAAVRGKGRPSTHRIADAAAAVFLRVAVQRSRHWPPRGTPMR